MELNHTARRISVIRKIGWLSVASMLALAMLAPTAAPTFAAVSGAIWTSLGDGTAVNANIYDAKEDVYLNGGPQNCGQSGGLPDGNYYFQVTDPSGAILLSSDALKFRQVKVVNGVIAGISGTGNHITGTGGCNGGLPVQLQPYNTTPNNGGEYSLDLATLADVGDCAGFDANSAAFNFLSCTNGKNDNYKVRLAAPAIAIQKVADPIIVPASGGDVTYTYTVSNPGDTGLTNVSVEDDKCDAPSYVSGDTIANGLLDLSESWVFTCSTFITVPTTNTAIAHGWDGDTEVTAQDQAFVDVAPLTTTSSTTTSSTTTSSTTTQVLGETDDPGVSLPPTDGIDGSSAPSSVSWRVLLIIAAALLASVMVMGSTKAATRRR